MDVDHHLAASLAVVVVIATAYVSIQPPYQYMSNTFQDRGYGGGRRDDYRRGGGGGYRDRYDDRGDRGDRGYGGGRRDDYGGPPRTDRYASSRGDDRYGGERRGGGGGYSGGGYDRAPRGPPAEAAGYDAAAPRDAPREPPPARNYDREPRRYD